MEGQGVMGEVFLATGANRAVSPGGCGRGGCEGQQGRFLPQPWLNDASWTSFYRGDFQAGKMRFKWSHFLASWVHSSITEMEEGRKKKGGGAQGPEIAGAEVTGCCRQREPHVSKAGAHQGHGSRAIVLQSTDSLY